MAAVLSAGVLLGCRSSIETACDRVAPDWNGQTVGAFATTLGRVRNAYPLQAWLGVANESLAIVCFVDGSIPKAPEGGEPYDRAVVVVVNGDAELVLAGYRTQVLIRAP